jgi:hypothetical protein
MHIQSELQHAFPVLLAQFLKSETYEEANYYKEGAIPSSGGRFSSLHVHTVAAATHSTFCIIET